MFMSLSPEERACNIKIHQNLGHPSKEKLGEVLRQQGYDARIIQGLQRMRCSVCLSQQKPSIQKPATLKEDLDFNDKIGVDGVTFTTKQGSPMHFYHVVDYSTNYQAAFAAPSKSSTAIVETLVNGWFQWAGPPGHLVTDAGTELTSHEFATMTNQFNIKLQVALPGAHWQLGKVERHGDVLQSMLSKYEAEHPIVSYKDLQTALSYCTAAKNALSLKGGFTPEMLVFGKAIRLPGSLCSDLELPAHSLADSACQQGIQFRENLARREIARRVFHAADNDQALRRALLRRTRPSRGHYEPGTLVMLWKQTINQKGWYGPARVIQQEGQTCVWCNHMGNILKVAPEHVRPVSAAEEIHVPPEIPTVQSLETAVREEPVQPTNKKQTSPQVEILKPCRTS